ncbi:MAG: porin [Holosporales bacterium]
MKKLLLCTVASAVLMPVLASNAMAAATPSLQISGQSTFNAMSFRQDEKKQNGGYGNGNHFSVPDTRLNFDVFGKADGWGELEYSFLLGYNANADNDADSNVEEARLKFKGEWGTLMMGNFRGAEERGAVGAYTVMGGTGGVDGNYMQVAQLSTDVIRKVDASGASKDATKVMYATPRVSNFQLVVAYTPSTQHKGDGDVQTIATKKPGKGPFDKNQVAFAGNYMNDFANGWGLKLSATALFGNAQRIRAADNGSAKDMKFRNTKSYALGGIVSYGGWDLGAEWIDNGKSRVERDPTIGRGRTAGKIYSFALGYTFGVDRFAAGYYHSTRKIRKDFGKARADVYSVTWDRKLAPGLSVFAEGNLFKYRTNSRDAFKTHYNTARNGTYSKVYKADFVPTNRGHVILVGSKLKF